MGNTRPVTVASARAAVDLLTSTLTEEDRRLALLGILAGLHVAFRRRGAEVPAWLDVLMEDAVTPSLDLIRAELRREAAERSWRDLGREIGLNPRTVQLIAERGTKPRPRTETRLRRWRSRRRKAGE